MFCACEHTNDSKWRQILQYSDFIRKEHLHVVDKISVESVHFRVFEYKELVYHIHAGGIDIWEKFFSEALQRDQFCRIFVQMIIEKFIVCGFTYLNCVWKMNIHMYRISFFSYILYCKRGGQFSSSLPYTNLIQYHFL